MKNYFHNDFSQRLPQVYPANRTHTIGLLSKATGRHLIHPNHIRHTELSNGPIKPGCHAPVPASQKQTVWHKTLGTQARNLISKDL